MVNHPEISDRTILLPLRLLLRLLLHKLPLLLPFPLTLPLACRVHQLLESDINLAEVADNNE